MTNDRSCGLTTSWYSTNRHNTVKNCQSLNKSSVYPHTSLNGRFGYASGALLTRFQRRMSPL
ncbi:protein of unknown function (plasmid) [Paraburkholderia kururiensis]